MVFVKVPYGPLHESREVERRRGTVVTLAGLTVSGSMGGVHDGPDEKWVNIAG